MAHGVLRARRGRSRRARGALLRSADAHRPRRRRSRRSIDGLARACAQAKPAYGIDASLILCFLRHLSGGRRVRDARAGAAVSRQVHRRRARQRRARQSAREVRARVRALPRARPASSSRTRARRGRRRTSRPRSTCCTSSASTTACAASRIRRWCSGSRARRCRSPCARCPTSSCACIPTSRTIRCKALLDAGICATVNSDDPAYFGGYVNRNFTRDVRGAAADGRATPTRSRATASRPASRTRRRSGVDRPAGRGVRGGVTNEGQTRVSVRIDRKTRVRLEFGYRSTSIENASLTLVLDPFSYSCCSGTNGASSEFCRRRNSVVSGSVVRTTSPSSSIVSHSRLSPSAPNCSR